jgi:2-dehydro-3-deoxyphosphogluconate aldolase/(4S)-4-hydroxy-2-oxoglutarate aldolase
MNRATFKQLPLLGILRGISQSSVKPIADVSMSAGLRAIEITMNTEAAPILIDQMRNYCGNKLSVGAGTVTSLDLLNKAVDAGAQFIVMPIINQAIIEYCNDNAIPVFPGALTPNEIYSAWEMGATMVKVFPASVFGPSYFKEIKAPLNDVELLACGGVSEKTIGDFFRNGASAAAFSTSIYKKEWIDSNRYDCIEQELRILIDAYHSWKNTNE